MVELFLKGYNVSDIFKYCLSMLNTERIISLMKETYKADEVNRRYSKYLFRAKALKNGQFVYGDLFHYNNSLPTIVYNKFDDNGNFKGADEFSVHPDTIGMFTGSHDQKNVPIYEGDIATDGKFIYTVIYSLNSCAFVWDRHGSSTNFHFEKSDQLEMLILGNKWDNPELKEQETYNGNEYVEYLQD